MTPPTEKEMAVRERIESALALVDCVLTIEERETLIGALVRLVERESRIDPLDCLHRSWTKIKGPAWRCDVCAVEDSFDPDRNEPVVFRVVAAPEGQD